MSFRVAWLTGSRFVRNGTVFRRQGQNTLKDNISGCRYEATVTNVPYVVAKFHSVVAKLPFIKYGSAVAAGAGAAGNVAVAVSGKDKTVDDKQKEDSIFKITTIIVEKDVKGKETNRQPTTHGTLAKGKQPNQQPNTILAQAKGMQLNQKLTTNIPPVK